ncbi:MAG: hypothetical protein OEX22_03435 [Cyclobacteriaceae bacterium]|nr:hypothetical protein [Cyclobacteriaceae bacterium]
MKTVSVKELKTELVHRSHNELLDICLHLSKFKKENKALLTYLLFESSDEEGYINSVKNEVDIQFKDINTSSFYFIKKSVRKILRTIKTYIRYSKIKETEIQLLLYFCEKLKDLTPSISKNMVLTNLHAREIASIRKKIKTLHEDLQYDYSLALEKVLLSQNSSNI